MSMNSKYPDHECKKCGIMIKKDDIIHKVDAGHFCKNENCPNSPSGTVPDSEPKPEETKPVTTVSQKLLDFAAKENKIISEITQVVTEQLQKQAKPGETVRGDVVWVRTKEIYNIWNEKN